MLKGDPQHCKEKSRFRGSNHIFNILEGIFKRLLIFAAVSLWLAAYLYAIFVSDNTYLGLLIFSIPFITPPILSFIFKFRSRRDNVHNRHLKDSAH